MSCDVPEDNRGQSGRSEGDSDEQAGSAVPGTKVMRLEMFMFQVIRKLQQVIKEQGKVIQILRGKYEDFNDIGLSTY